MDIVSIGLIVSTASVFVLAVLFAIETRRGARFADSARRYADYGVLRASRAVHRVVQYVTVHVVRQIGHYIVHVLLASTLAFIRRGEKAVRGIMRTNKTLARTAERDRATKNKLEEIALHKLETTLTEKEKAAHKDRALKG